MMSQSKQDRVTIKVLEEMKSNNEKISMLTSYDYSFAKIIDSAGIDIILVGDLSLIHISEPTRPY